MSLESNTNDTETIVNVSGNVNVDNKQTEQNVIINQDQPKTENTKENPIDNKTENKDNTQTTTTNQENKGQPVDLLDKVTDAFFDVDYNQTVDINEIPKDQNNNNNQNNIKPEENKHILMPDYYDENNKLNYEGIVQQENDIRMEIEKTTPLISELFEIAHLEKEFNGSIFEQIIKDEIMPKYQGVRYVRRDGNNILLIKS